jgi:hypothetical protein
MVTKPPPSPTAPLEPAPLLLLLLVVPLELPLGPELLPLGPELLPLGPELLPLGLPELLPFPPPSSSSFGGGVVVLPLLHAAAAANPASETIESNAVRELKERFMMRFSGCKNPVPGGPPRVPQATNARRLVP